MVEHPLNSVSGAMAFFQLKLEFQTVYIYTALYAAY